MRKNNQEVRAHLNPDLSPKKALGFTAMGRRRTSWEGGGGCL